MSASHDIPARPRPAASSHEMHGHAPAGSPDTWVFNIEAVSTLCIAAWYMFGVFISLGLLPRNRFYEWGNGWVIPFLLGIFYLGAGYLYQRHQRIWSLQAWGRYMRREVIVLATPFVAFTVLVLATNSALHASPSLSPANLGLALTVSPVVPVGYFEVLFFIYVLTHTPRTRGGMVGLLAAALAAKIAVVVCSDAGVADGWLYAVREVPDNWIWFVCGVAVSFFGLEDWLEKPLVAAGSTVAFLDLAAVLFGADVRSHLGFFALTALALLAFYSMSAARFGTGRQDAFFGFVTRYTMAIWLMHEIVAELVMAGLGALGVTSAGVLGAACVVACYVLPVAIMWALSKVWKLGFIVYPSRYLPAEL